jgi:hypothetical protein
MRTWTISMRPPALKNLAKNKLNKAFLGRRELKKLPDMLAENEHVVNLAHTTGARG